MENKELALLRRRVNAIISKRRKINECLDDETVQRFARLIEVSDKKEDLEDIRGILTEILPGFHVKISNGIYVCTKAFDIDSRSPIRTYFEPERINVDCKCYKDIETEKEIQVGFGTRVGVVDFERGHIVLNPKNEVFNGISSGENGYEGVRLDFFEACYRYGQPKAIGKILGKYPAIGTRGKKE